jgi:HK97 family phage portal protein
MRRENKEHLMTLEKQSTSRSTTKKKGKPRPAKRLRVGEGLNPDNLRYLDNQGMPQEEMMGGVWSSEVKAFMSAQTLKALFYSEDWVFITTDSIALPISQCPVVVFDEARAEDGKNRRTMLENHPVTKLMANPNNVQTNQEIMYSYAVDTILGGNGFLYHSPDLDQIYHMPFERVAYDFHADGTPKCLFFYRQHMDDAFIQDKNSALLIPLEHVIHSRRPNPSSAFWGLSPFVPGRRSILFNRYSQDYLLAFYLKGATPQMILTIEKASSQKALVRMIRAFEAAYTGRRNQRRTLVLPEGVKAQPADSKIADQQLSELVKANRETVLNILRVPKHALGLQESGSLGSREHELALRWYWEQTILPTMGLMEAALTRHFLRLKMIAPGQVVGFDTSEVKYVQEDLMQMAETSEKLATTWTLNERRERVFGLNPVDNGDVVQGMQPAAPFAFSQGVPPEKISVPSEKNPGVPDVPPEEPALLAEDRIDSTPDEGTVNAAPGDEPTQTPAEAPWHARVVEKYRDQLTSGEGGMRAAEGAALPKMNKTAGELLVAQTEAAIRAFASSTNDRAEFEWSIQGFKKKFRELMKGAEKEYLKDYNTTLSSTMEMGYDTQLEMVFDPQAKEALAAYKERDVAGQRQILSERGLFSFQSALDTTSEKVMSVIEKSMAAGKTIQETSKSILKFMKDEAPWRANMIARTETLTAFSIGGMATMERAKEVIPGMKKMWVTGNDDRVRDAHVALMGKVTGPDEEFAKDLRFPRDPACRDGALVINCRCTALMLPPEDVEDYVDEINSMSKKPVEVEQ